MIIGGVICQHYKSTAIRIFLNASLEHNGLPFPVAHNKQYNESFTTIQDARLNRNLNGPYKSAKEAVSDITT